MAAPGGSGAGPTSGLGALNGARIGGARTGRAGQSAGRGGLMRQAVMMLVHYPPIAGQLEAAELAGLEGLEQGRQDLFHGQHDAGLASAARGAKGYARRPPLQIPAPHRR